MQFGRCLYCAAFQFAIPSQVASYTVANEYYSLTCVGEIMTPKATEKKSLPFSPIKARLIRNSLIACLLSAAAVPTICFILGWRSLENIGTGFIYGSLVLMLSGALILAGNTVPAQLSQLSLPKYISSSLRRHQEAESDGTMSIGGGIIFFFTTLI